LLGRARRIRGKSWCGWGCGELGGWLPAGAGRGGRQSLARAELHEPRGPREELLAHWAGTCRWGPFPARWAGLGERLALWAVWGRRPLLVRDGLQAPGTPASPTRGASQTVGPAGRELGQRRPGVGVGSGLTAQSGRRPAQRASRSPSQGRRPWKGNPTNTPSGPTGQPFLEPCGP
jgi:hypothetical protein